MGREVKRVPLDFDWPLNEVWRGFLNPYSGHSSNCLKCNGSGASPEADLLKQKWYGYVEFDPAESGSAPFKPTHPAVVAGVTRKVDRDLQFYVQFSGLLQTDLPTTEARQFAIDAECERMATIYNSSLSHHLTQDDVNALVEEGRLHDFTHTYIEGSGWVKNDPLVVPTAEDVNVWSLNGMSHDSINCWVVIKARCKQMGVSDTCTACAGHGCVWEPGFEKLYDEWEPEQPPTGPGYQLWETVTEGSPISPVFATASEFIDYLISQGYSEQAARNFVRAGWVPSMIMTGGECKMGIEAAADFSPVETDPAKLIGAGPTV